MNEEEVQVAGFVSGYEMMIKSLIEDLREDIEMNNKVIELLELISSTQEEVESRKETKEKVDILKGTIEIEKKIIDRINVSLISMKDVSVLIMELRDKRKEFENMLSADEMKRIRELKQ